MAFEQVLAAQGRVKSGRRVDGVDTRGAVVASGVSKSSGHASLDTAALNAIRRCSFKPGMQDGKAVQARTNVQYVWTLN